MSIDVQPEPGDRAYSYIFFRIINNKKCKVWTWTVCSYNIENVVAGCTYYISIFLNCKFLDWGALATRRLRIKYDIVRISPKK